MIKQIISIFLVFSLISCQKPTTENDQIVKEKGRRPVFDLPHNFVPKYKVVETDSRYIKEPRGKLVKKTVIKIKVKRGLKRKKIRLNIKDLVNKTVKNDPHVNAIMVLVYRKKDRQLGLFTVAMGIWAPKGNWHSPESFRVPKLNKLHIEFKEDYFRRHR